MASGTNNKEISALLGAIADALEIKAQDEFRARAFRIGARRVETVDVEVAGAVLENRLDALPGIGDTMGKVIAEFVQTGASTELAEARAGIPDGVFEILAIQGIGSKTASRLFNELEIVDVDGLEAAAQSGRLRELSGMGPKKVQTYLREIERLRERRGSFRLGQALPEGLALLAALGEAGGLTAANPAGEMRRGCPTVRCIELVVASDDTEATARTFSGLCRVTESGPALARGATKSGIPVVLHLTTPDDFAVTLIHHSGSATHLEKITQSQTRSESGWVKRARLPAPPARRCDWRTRKRFSDLLGLQFIPAELREDRGEIEAAQQGQLPRLVEIGDIRGDLHTHTRWSDGATHDPGDGRRRATAGACLSDRKRPFAVVGGGARAGAGAAARAGAGGRGGERGFSEPGGAPRLRGGHPERRDFGLRGLRSGPARLGDGLRAYGLSTVRAR